ncbi:hypothetical protein K458DRAFT_975 [Lentithecium fluviatile CBS 122367]|uniref:Uncharacterized protein n=1 Tax=Lentithecium fluviatile CBS 122367 TaxID=1168545 RepID=A0A6G1JLW2_9PLEO|nr:hypothetical protein K458DRAFT_975 [Lentithecium fluviatile CBS 122367]
MSDRLLKMLAVLNPQTNPSRANSFFNGLDILVGDLRNRFPNDYVVFGLVRALERLELFYQLNFVKASTNLNQWSLVSGEAEDGTDGAIAKDESHIADCSPSGLNSATASHPGQHSKDGQFTSGDQNSNEGPRLSGKRRIQLQKKGRRLACPIRRHQEVHGQDITCGFDGAANMWGVTQHLRTLKHSHPFIALCRHCWIYVTDQEEYHNVHKNSLCALDSQPRGLRVPELWQKLYRSIYPGSNRIPSGPMNGIGRKS